MGVAPVVYVRLCGLKCKIILPKSSIINAEVYDNESYTSAFSMYKDVEKIFSSVT